MKGKQSNRAVAKKIGENKTVVEKKKSTQKSSTGLKITEKRGRQKEKRGNRSQETPLLQIHREILESVVETI